MNEQAVLPIVELGGGRSPLEHLNLDAIEGEKVDLRQGIPLPDHSVAVLHSSDFYEHLTFEEGLALMRECKRVLASGGMVDFTIPDMAAAFAYHNKGPGTGWNGDLELCCYGDRSNEWQTHKAWYTPALLKHAWESEGWRVETEFTQHGWPNQPKFRIKAWPLVERKRQFALTIVSGTIITKGHGRSNLDTACWLPDGRIP